MTESSWPFDNNVDTSEQQFSTLLRKISDTGVEDTAAGTLLRPYGDSTGMFVKVPAGSAVINGFQYLNDSLVTKPIAAAESQPRIDTVVLSFNPVANTILIDVKKGTASTSPTAPALTQADNPIGVWEEPLGDVSVPANSNTVTSGNVADRRRFTSHRYGHWTNATRPASPRRGKAGYNESTNQPEWFDGSSWRPFSVATTDASLLTAGTLKSARLDYGVLQAFRGDRSVDAPVSGDTINGDWNAVLQPGSYRVWAGNTNQNAPGGAYMYGTLIVFGGGSNVASRTQLYCTHGPNRVYSRTAWNGNDWSGWSLLAVSGDVDGIYNQYDNGRLDGRYYRESEIDTAFGQRDGSINQRVVNQANAVRVAAGNALVSNFAKDSNTGQFVGYVDVGWPAFSGGLTAVTATAQSADGGGVVAETSNLSSSGCRITLVRRNQVNTGVGWAAYGN